MFVNDYLFVSIYVCRCVRLSERVRDFVWVIASTSVCYYVIVCDCINVSECISYWVWVCLILSDCMLVYVNESVFMCVCENMYIWREWTWVCEIVCMFVLGIFVCLIIYERVNMFICMYKYMCMCKYVYLYLYVHL